MKLVIALWLTFLGLVAFSRAAENPLLGEILIAFERANDCDTCHDLLIPVKKLAEMGDDAFAETFTTICQILKLDDDDVCDGIMHLRTPAIAASLRNFPLGSITATRFCAVWFSLCPDPPATPYKVPFPKPKPTHPKQIESKGRKIEVVHFSDVHIDRAYTVGAEANCTKNICCRNFPDHKGPVETPAEPFGNSKCDSPPDLATSMLDSFEVLAPNASFAIFTGDTVEGNSWDTTKSEVVLDLTAWNDQMAAYTNLTIYPALGNHDTNPVNHFIPDDFPTNESSQYVYNIQSDGWKQWIGAAAANEIRHHSGSILSVNTQLWYRSNALLYHGPNLTHDPNGIMKFMVEQLQLAEDDGARVLLIGHIPPGKHDSMIDYSNFLDQIFSRYIHTFCDHMHNGHSHRDQMEIGYSDWLNPVAETAQIVSLITGSLTPTSGNPTYATIEFDPDTCHLIDRKVYIANISDPGFQHQPKWEFYYSMRDSYGPFVPGWGQKDPLNATFFHKVTERFEQDDDAFQIWNARQSREGMVSPCTGDCKRVTICDMRALRSENNCDTQGNVPDINFRRDVTGSWQEADECEGPSFRGLIKPALSGAHTGELGPSAEMKTRIREALDNLDIKG